MLSVNGLASINNDHNKHLTRNDISSLPYTGDHVCSDAISAMASVVYHCGACTRTFRTICLLHDHLQGTHTSTGCYHYISTLRTAFPKYDTVCCFTQTGDPQEEGGGVTSPVPCGNNSKLCDKPAVRKVRKKRVKVNVNKNCLEPVTNLGKGAAKVESKQSEQQMNDGKWSVENFIPLVNGALDNEVEDGCSAPKKKKAKLKSNTKVPYGVNKDMPSIDKFTNILESNTEVNTKATDDMNYVIKLPNKSLKDDLKKPNRKKPVTRKLDNKTKNNTKKPKVVKNSDKDAQSETPSSPIDKINLNISSVISLKCHFCLKVHNNQQELTTHMKTKHRGKPTLMCPMCSHMFTSQQDLDEHMAVHHNSVFTNSKDSLTTIAANDLADTIPHVETEKGAAKKGSMRKKEVEDTSPYTCHVCSVVMPMHKKDVHQRLHSGERPYICELCGKGLISQTKLKRHMLIHSEVKKHKCDVCGVGFQMKYKLRMHMHIHTGKKPYLCSICGAEFNHSANLATHTRCVHLQIKPFECKVCGGMYAKRSQLDDHALSHTTERQFTCRFCGKSFKYLKGMKRHEKKHLEDKTLSCNKCDAQFMRMSDLTEHTSKSHSMSAMKCDVCKKVFMDEGLYKEHKATHCDSKKYQCALCGEYYKVCNKYYTHMLAAHGIDREQAKALHNQHRALKDIAISGTDPMIPISHNLNLHSVASNMDEVSRLDSIKVTNSAINPSFSVRQMVTGLLEGNQTNISTISALTRAATENLRLHSQDIQDEEKLSTILTPLNPLVVMDRNQDMGNYVPSNTGLIDPSRATTDTVGTLPINTNLNIQTDNQPLPDVTRDGLPLPNRATRIGLINMNDMLGINQDGGGFIGRLGERYQPLNTISLIPISTAMNVDQAALLEHESNMALRRLAQNTGNQEVPQMIVAGSNAGLVQLDAGSQHGNQSDPQSASVGYQIQNLY